MDMDIDILRNEQIIMFRGVWPDLRVVRRAETALLNLAKSGYTSANCAIRRGHRFSCGSSFTPLGCPRPD